MRETVLMLFIYKYKVTCNRWHNSNNSDVKWSRLSLTCTTRNTVRYP